MKFVYVCPRCKTVYTDDSNQPNETQMCPDCKDYIYYLKCTKEEWDQKNAEEKTERIEATIAEKIQKATDPNFLMLEKLTKIENHLSIVKGILVFFTVLSILGALILLINIS